MRIFIAEGYLLEELSSNKIHRLFICQNQSDIIAKTNISTANVKNYTIALGDIERMDQTDPIHAFHEIILVGDTFQEIDHDTFEELKTKTYEIWSIPQELYNRDIILKM
jgi:hypothetical protein